MLARLTRVVVLHEDALPRGNTRAEVRATLATINVIVVDLLVAVLLRTADLRLGHIDRGSSGEELDSEGFVLFALYLGYFRESFKFDKCL